MPAYRERYTVMKLCRKRILSFILLALAVSLLLQPHVSAQISVAPIPDAPAETVYVSDLANVLSEETRAAIAGQSAALDALTGAQLAVVTVDFLGGEAIQAYADNLFSRLQLGDPAKNNGLLLLLVIGEENYYALQGQGLEAALPDASLQTLLQQSLEPDFAAGDYEAGVQKTYDSLLSALESLYGIGDEGVLAAAAQAKAAQIRIEKADKQKQLLLMAIGAVLLILLALLVAVRHNYARRRQMRRRAAARQSSDV